MKTILITLAIIASIASSQSQITWSVRNTGIPYNILGISYINDTTVFASSQNEGYIIKSTNTGNNWTTVTNFPTQWMEWITFPDQNTGYTVGSNGRIYKSSNAGSNWFQQASGLFSNWFYEAQFVNSNTGWVVGSDNIIIKTTNGGTNWNTQLTGVGQLRSLFFINNDTGWVVGTGSIITKTTNSGTNWVSQTAGGDFSSVHFTSAQTGYISTFGSQIMKTTNGGTNWFLNYTHSPAQQLENINFTDQSTGWCVGGGGTILKTTNAGVNWATISSPTNNYLVTIRFMNYNTGWITGTGIVLVSTNGSGVTPPGAPASLTALGVSNTRINLNWSDTNSTETGFKIQRSTNAGANWILKDSVPANTTTYSDTGLTQNTIYHYRVFAYNIGGISPYSNIAFDTTLNIVGLIHNGSEIPKEFSLYQNYPNPFNPSSVIRFSIPLSRGVSEGRGVSLKIFDLLGKQVATLVNEELKPGSYEVTFDAGKLSSGIYIYKLETDGFSYTKRMVLIK